MRLFEIWILLFVYKLIVAEKNQTDSGHKETSDDKFLSGIQILYPKDEHLCGGVLVSSRHVLTAAYCIEGFDEGWNLKLLILKSGDGTQERHALTFAIHSGYNRETLENNLAIIKTSTAFETNADFQPIVVSDTNTTEDCFVVTWSSKGKFITRASQQNPQQVFEEPTSACSINVDNTFCMGNNKNATVCNEDYGCPLVCNGLLVGVFIGPGHACDGYPGVYVKVKAYQDWITSSTVRFRRNRKSPHGYYKRTEKQLVAFVSTMLFINMVCP